MGGVGEAYYASASAEVPCFLKSMRTLSYVLYYEFGNDHHSSYVEIGSTIVDLDLRVAQSPITAKVYLQPANLDTHGEEVTI